MKKLFFLLTCLGTLLVSGLHAYNLQALFSHNTFSSPDKGPYIETYLSVAGNTVQYVKLPDGKFQASIQIIYTFEQNNVIKYADKYVLLSPEVSDTNNVGFQFIDQQRIPLPNGEYDMTLNIADKNSPNKPFDYKEKVVVDIQNDAVTLSNVELLESVKKAEKVNSLTKSGYDMVPMVSNYYPKEIKSIHFYAEIYNSKKAFNDSAFLVRYYIQNDQKKYLVEPFSSFYKQTPAGVNIVMGEFDIKTLVTGNYNLVVEVKNRKNQVVARQFAFFQRNNNYTADVLSDSALAAMDISTTFASYYTNRDSLVDYIKSLRPISTHSESLFADNQLQTADVKLMQQFLFGFWARHEPNNPQAGWENYHKLVWAVDKSYGTRLLRGYETDRGRVYIKYGPPNAIASNLTAPNIYPYQIWHYFKTGKQSNKKFVFYNPDLVTNDFTLVHSTAVGEPNDPNWQFRLKSRNTPNGGVDGTDTGESRLKQDFDSPY